MKNLLLFLGIFSSSLLFSQNNSKIELLGSLDYSYRYIASSGFVSSVRDTEIGRLNTHFGINYLQKLRSRLWLKMGVGFASTGYKTEKIRLMTTVVDPTGMGVVDPTLLGIENPTVQFLYNHQFFEIPISVQLTLLDEKVKVFTEFGFVTKYYIQTIVKHELGGKIRSKTSNQEDIINDLQYGIQLAFGLSFPLNKSCEMVAQPNFRYHLSKIADAPVVEHLWSTGIALGIRMNLK